MAREQDVRTDRFGNSYTLKRTTKKKGKTGDTEFNHAYFEIGKQLYKIEVSEAEKEGKYENSGDYWVKVTKSKPKQKGSL